MVRSKNSKNKTAENVEAGARVAGIKDYGMLIAPVVTEKTAGDKSRVVFMVKTESTKTEVKEAIQRVFQVKVKSVRTVNMQGKVKRTTSATRRQASYKKAYITLKPGYSIDMVEGV